MPNPQIIQFRMSGHLKDINETAPQEGLHVDSAQIIYTDRKRLGYSLSMCKIIHIETKTVRSAYLN